MKQFWVSYLISFGLLVFLCALIAENTFKDGMIAVPLVWSMSVFLPAICMSFWEPKIKKKTLFGFIAALAGLILSILMMYLFLHVVISGAFGNL